MYVRLVVNGPLPRRSHPARSADRHSPDAAPLVRAAQETVESEPDAFPIREPFGLTVVGGSKPARQKGYGADDPILEILVDVGLIADERLQQWFRASTDPSIGGASAVSLTGISFRDGIAAAEAQVREHLNSGEQILAVGRADDVTEAPGATGGHSFVMVTDRALRWVMNHDLRLEASLDLGSITDVSERTAAHRYAIDLDHRPIRHAHFVPAHRVLSFEWGGEIANDVFTRTSIAFSRRDTAAASALRERLTAHGLLETEPPQPGAAEEPFTPPSGL
jgi:hypothetical protein